MTKNVLYISYDGMTDALGQSQVLPYICGISKNGYHFTLISCEKEEKYENGKAVIQQICTANNIDWVPLKYTKKPPVVSTIYDIYQILTKAKQLHRSKNFYLVHCRGYISAFIGLSLKINQNLKFIFDMRGFWADEKLDSGNWKLSHPIYKMVYRYFKAKEKDFFEKSDFTVSLTENGANYIRENFKVNDSQIGVIPTCVDYSNFYIQDDDTILQFKSKLGIDPCTKIMLYSGSLGTDSYDFNIVMMVYQVFQNFFKDSCLLVLSKDKFEGDRPSADSNFKIINAPFLEVNNYLNISDYAFVFYNQGWSNIGRSPTKLGEYLATGLNVISYGKMGDVSNLKEKMNIFEVQNLDQTNMENALEFFNQRNKSRQEIAIESHDYYDLDRGVKFYTNIYKSLDK